LGGSLAARAENGTVFARDEKTPLPCFNSCDIVKIVKFIRDKVTGGTGN